MKSGFDEKIFNEFVGAYGSKHIGNVGCESQKKYGCE